MAKPFMFGTVGKLFQSSIFSACQIFKLGPQSRLPAAENIVPESTKFRWSDVKELKDMWFPIVRGMFMPNFDFGSTFVAEIFHFLLLRMRARAQSQKIGLFVDSAEIA